jgi:hypothetical protein
MNLEILQGGKLAQRSHQIAQISFKPSNVFCRTPPVVRVFCSKFSTPHRGKSLGPFVCGANEEEPEAHEQPVYEQASD